MKRFLRLLAIGLPLFLALLAFLLLTFGIKRPTRVQDYLKTDFNRWNRIELTGNVVSSDGSDYYLLTKKGKGSNIVIYFSGGGANWNAETAASPMTFSSILKGEGRYFSNIPFYKLSLMGGILDENNPENPFNDWTIVYIPYSTGDFHIGNSRLTYEKANGRSFEVIHNGQNNVRATLEWVTQNLAAPEKLFIAGESAGGFGAAFWAPTITDLYPDSRIYLYTDSSCLVSDQWPSIIDNVWKADFESTFGYKPEADLVAAAVSYAAKTVPNISILQSNTCFDGLLAGYQKLLNTPAEESLEKADLEKWKSTMTASMRGLSEALPFYSFYLTDDGLNPSSGSTVHTLSCASTFYEAKEEGITPAQWLKELVIEDKAYSVGMELLNR